VVVQNKKNLEGKKVYRKRKEEDGKVTRGMVSQPKKGKAF